MKGKRKKEELKIEFIEGREMTPTEYDAFINILFKWLKRDLEAGELNERTIQTFGRGAQP